MSLCSQFINSEFHMNDIMYKPLCKEKEFKEFILSNNSALNKIVYAANSQKSLDLSSVVKIIVKYSRNVFVTEYKSLLKHFNSENHGSQPTSTTQQQALTNSQGVATLLPNPSLGTSSVSSNNVTQPFTNSSGTNSGLVRSNSTLETNDKEKEKELLLKQKEKPFEKEKDKEKDKESGKKERTHKLYSSSLLKKIEREKDINIQYNAYLPEEYEFIFQSTYNMLLTTNVTVHKAIFVYLKVMYLFLIST